ncbi:hypothetical protein C1H46_022963 [Malus baccata]|uniref:Uncharacterized protein n=1 Tax=Malus baccata TaxID=106549 RepID=A0A540LYE7_MALBA|nr:hypothetical protein C1H46_022963 [Malus baccata]
MELDLEVWHLWNQQKVKRGAVFGGNAARYALRDATAKFVIVMDVVDVLAKPFFVFFGE